MKLAETPITDMREIINHFQAALLTHLESVVDCNRKSLQQESGVTNGSYERQMRDLKERELVWQTEPQGMIPSRISITMRGLRAIKDHRDHLSRPVVAPPAKTNLMKQPQYEPSKQAYYRNNGNSQIPSRGF